MVCRSALIIVAIALLTARSVEGQALKAPSALASLQAVPYLSTLVSYLQHLNMTETVGPELGGTLFAPQDAGFANFTKLLGLNSPADLLAPEHQDLLTKVIQFHIVPGPPLNAMQLQDRQKLPTVLTGESITVSLDTPGLIHFQGGSPLNVATFLGYQKVRGDKAVVFVTDQVLIPSAIINNTPQLASKLLPPLA